MNLLVVPTQLHFPRPHVIEYPSASRRPRHPRQNQLQILEPSQRAPVQHQNRILHARSRRLRLEHDVQIDVLRPEGPERVVHLVAGIFRYSVGGALDHGVVVVRIGQADPFYSHDQFQVRKVQQLTVVVFRGGAHENVQVAFEYVFS